MDISGSLIVSNGITGSLLATNNVVSSSQQIKNYNVFATTGSNHFYGDQIIEGDSFVELQVGESYGGGTVF